MIFRTFLLSMIMTLLTFVFLGGSCYGQNYVPTANEECYGTWINEKTINQGHIQKKICTAMGNKDYYEVSDSVPLFEDEQQIYAKWTDSEGNIWYKTFGTVIAGAYKGTKWQELDKFSKSATVWEYVFQIIVFDFDPNSYPTKVDPEEGNYRIFYRSEDNNTPTSVDERFGTWTNEKLLEFQKIVWDAHGYREYSRASDQDPIVIGVSEIASKWKDSDGNTWFKLFDTVVGGPFKGWKFNAILKISKSGTVQELVYHRVYGEFDPQADFPAIDPKDSEYCNYYRSGK